MKNQLRFRSSKKVTILIGFMAMVLLVSSAYAFNGTFTSRWHSEENQPAMCADDTVATKVQCSGSYCDNIRVQCKNPPLQHGSYTYTSYKSEEQGYNQCSNGYYVTGIDCHGSYCDNQSLQCTYMQGASHSNCVWEGPFSEEGPENWGECSSGKFAAGLYCSGSYCDNKWVYCCNM